jgi:hypothetical protein
MTIETWSHAQRRRAINLAWRAVAKMLESPSVRKRRALPPDDGASYSRVLRRPGAVKHPERVIGSSRQDLRRFGAVAGNRGSASDHDESDTYVSAATTHLSWMRCSPPPGEASH